MTANTPDAGREAALHAIREARAGLDAPTQRQRLLDALQSLGSVSTFEASRCLDIYHPPARAKELRQDGHRITTIRRPVQTEFGERHWVGVYILDRGRAEAEVSQ